MPLPDVAGEGRLGVDLVLMHVDGAVEYLHDGVDQARMPAEPPEGLVEGVGREGGSDDARLFAEILPALLREDARHLVHQDSRLLAREDFRQKEVTFLVELREL